MGWRRYPLLLLLLLALDHTKKSPKLNVHLSFLSYFVFQIRNTAHKTLVPGPTPPNPFSHGSWYHNLMNVLGRPAGYSWVQPYAVATEDKREVNPGMVSGEDEKDEGQVGGGGRGSWEEVRLNGGTGVGELDLERGRV